MDESTRRQTFRRVYLESRALEAVRALTAAEVEVRVVKGLTLRVLLYDEGEQRPYGDIDLLVDPAHWDRAREVIGGLGYLPAPSGGLFEHPIHSVAFRRAGPGGLTVDLDLHHRFHGVRVSSRVFWRTAGADPVTVAVGDGAVLTTPLPVTGFHLLVSASPEHDGDARHADEWRRFCARYPAVVPDVMAVAQRWRASTTAQRAIATIEGWEPERVPAPVSPKMRNTAMSAWVAHMRRSPSLRARVTFIREVTSDARVRRHQRG
jgi:hypothetical protein